MFIFSTFIIKNIDKSVELILMLFHTIWSEILNLVSNQVKKRGLIFYHLLFLKQKRIRPHILLLVV